MLLLPVLAGPDGRDPSVAPAPLGDPRAVDLARLRVAFHTDNGTSTPTPETQLAVRTAANAVAAAGAAVDEARPAGIEQAYELTRDLFAADGGAGVGMLLSMAGTIAPSPLLQRLGAVVHPFALASAQDFGALMVRCDVFRATMLTFFDRYDAIVCPVNAYPAPAHGTTFDDEHLPGFSYTMTYNLTGWPAVVVRAGTSPEGLPIGVQVVAAPWREDVALAIAARIEAVTGGWQPPVILAS
jgi:amidase